MEEPGSITNWIAMLKQGENEIAQKLWERYFTNLLRVAGRLLRGRPKTFEDEEDVAIVAFAEVLSATRLNQFPNVNDRDDLWHVLVRHVKRRSIDSIRYQTAQRRSILRTVDLYRSESEDPADLIPGPVEMVLLADTYQQLMKSVEGTGLEHVVRLRLEGYSNLEIAEKIGLSERSVERKLRDVRNLISNIQAR